MKELLEGTSQLQNENELNSDNQEVDSPNRMGEGSVHARGARVRVRPKWLQEFVRLEAR